MVSQLCAQDQGNSYSDTSKMYYYEYDAIIKEGLSKYSGYDSFDLYCTNRMVDSAINSYKLLRIWPCEHMLWT